MKIFEKKLDVQFFEDVESGKKNFEVRINDCDYQVGDIIELKAYGKCCNYCDGKSYKKYYSGNCSGWMNCSESEAETIRAKIVSIMNAELYNCDEVRDDVLVMFGSYDLRDVKKVLSDYFKVDRLPKDYVVLEIEVIDK
ncbi:hypothetical protein KF282_2519 [Lactococcus lactis subsp. lactis]|uniref:DUF3850 domain-containing protein n=1 Tax=Lactococcus lactis subsp. lactis TaxID=1360 RepID=A0A0V8CKH1_LACLL|nr:DUF3850 domain-containing protein [Lactococcus lactis]KSU01815.1 hypothetical protein KF282_2519 [Lactococcus lactis subsp. lactis]